MIAVFIIGIIAMLALLGVGLYLSISFIKQKESKMKPKTLIKTLGFMSIGFALSFIVIVLGFYLYRGISAKPLEYVFGLVCGPIFGLVSYNGLFSFILHYYAKNKGISEKTDKALFIIACVSIPLMVVSLAYYFNAFADYINKDMPLIYGISFTNGLKIFVRPEVYLAGTTQYVPLAGKANLAFYAICILSGAVLVYFLIDHKLYLEYHEHGLGESTFLIAFPAGIVGARLFYVIGQWNSEFWPAIQAGNYFAPLRIWDGGLTILGGALTGIVVGVLWIVFKKKKLNVFLVMDIAMPAILIAQGIGRWGNFFNCEVHGVAVSEQYFSWLPTIIFNNAHFSTGESAISNLVGTGTLYAPLFLIEGFINIFGYFLLAHVFGNRFRKYIELGDIGCGYFIWYGLVRAVLEPLRHQDFIMDDFWSWFWSIGFIAGGFLLIFINHLVRYLIRKKKGVLRVKETTLRNGIIFTSILIVLMVAFLVPSLILILTSPFKLEVGLNKLNIGFILLAFAVGLLFISYIPVFDIIEGCKFKKEGIEVND